MKTTSTTSTAVSTTRPVAPDLPAGAQGVEIAYRLVLRAAGVTDFEPVVRAVFADERGWSRAGFRFVERDDAPYLIFLVEPDDAQRLCRPYDVYRTYSCQNGPIVVLNAERWRNATPEWTGDLSTYKQMLVNHEVGHLLGLHHPDVQCPAAGSPAPVMAQQSTELHGCLPNPWPLEEEAARAGRHDLPLAPPFNR
jgi:hypothetical protein